MFDHLHGHVGGVHEVVPLVDGVGNPLDVGNARQHQHLIAPHHLGGELLVMQSSQGSQILLQHVLGGHQNVTAGPQINLKN